MNSIKKFVVIFSSASLLFFIIDPVLAQLKINSPEPEAELHIARMIYNNSDNSRGRFGGFRRPWWAIDWPDAEYHFTGGVRRLTTINIADDSQHLRLTDKEIFICPLSFSFNSTTFTETLSPTARTSSGCSIR